MPRKEVTIPCHDLNLEGILETPDSPGPLPWAGLVCHPHPLYGGNMFNNVTKAVKRALLEKGMACLRFNFRGAGKSDGVYDEGNGEKLDVKAALDYMESLEILDRANIALAGYSFGAWVALAAAAEDERPKALIGVSPPLDMYDFDFLMNERRPKLLVVGDRDFVCSVDRFNRLADQTPAPKTTEIFNGVDHFHVGNEDRISARVDHFLDGLSF